MSTKVSDPNKKGGAGFLWAIVAVVVIAIVVIGYIIFSGQGAKTEHLADREYEEVAFTADYHDGMVTLAAEGAPEDAAEVHLYEDFSCPHCATLAENTDADMKNAIEDGQLVVNVHPLNFLDRGNTDGHSTQAVAAMLAIAEVEDPALYWNYRSVLMEEQEDIYNKWSNDDFANAAEELGAPGDVVGSIRNGEYHDQAVEVAQGNAQQLEEQTGSVSSPRVLQNGQDVEVADINQWIDAVLGQ